MRISDRFSPRRLTVLISPVLILLGFAASSAAQVHLATSYRRSPELEAAHAKANAYLEEFWGRGYPMGEVYPTAPGISVAVAYKGSIVFSASIGYADLTNFAPATPETVYNIGSVSKVISTVAVLQLVEQGKVSLDDPIQKYAPTFPDKTHPVTIWHILTHTSGIRHYRYPDFPGTPYDEPVLPMESFEQCIEVFKDDPLVFEPGEYYHYSSFAVNLLQGVVESVSGMSFEDYLSQHVWEPAGMYRTGVLVQDRIVPGRATGHINYDGPIYHCPFGDLSYKWPSGGMISTAEDLARFGMAIENGTLLKPETVELMYTPQLDEVIRFYEDKPPVRMWWDQCLMWRLLKDDNERLEQEGFHGEGRLVIKHCGTVAGFNACIVIYPEEDLIVATTDNAEAVGFSPLLTIADFFRQADRASKVDE